MPKVKQTKKRKSSELLELSQPGEPSTSGLISPSEFELEPCPHPETKTGEQSTTPPQTSDKSAADDDCVITETPPRSKVKVEVIDLTDEGTVSLAPILCTSVRLPLVSGDTQIKSEVDSKSVLAGNNTGGISKHSGTGASGKEVSTIRNVTVKPEVYHQIPILGTVLAENVTDGTGIRLINNVPVHVEQIENGAVGNSSTLKTDDVSQIGVIPDECPVKREKNGTNINYKNSSSLINNVPVHLQQIENRVISKNSTPIPDDGKELGTIPIECPEGIKMEKIGANINYENSDCLIKNVPVYVEQEENRVVSKNSTLKTNDVGQIGIISNEFLVERGKNETCLNYENSGRLINGVPVHVEQIENRVVSQNFTSIPDDGRGLGSDPIECPVKRKEIGTNINFKNSGSLIHDVPDHMEQNENRFVSNNSTLKTADERHIGIIPYECPMKRGKIGTNINYDNGDCLINDVPVLGEENENRLVSNNSSSIPNDGRGLGIIPIECPVKIGQSKSNENSDMELCEPKTFPCKLLKYLNCYPIYDGEEIGYCISILKNLMEDKNEIIAVESEPVIVSSDSDDVIELCLDENREELPTHPIGKKHTINLKEGEIGPEISSKDLVSSEQNIIVLDSDSDSSDLEMPILERQDIPPSSRVCVDNKKQMNIFTNTHHGLPSKIIESSRVCESNPHTNNCNSTMDTESKIDDMPPPIKSLSSLNGNKQSEILDGSRTLPIEGNKIPDVDVIDKKLLLQILDITKKREISSDIKDINFPRNPSFDQIECSTTIIDENMSQNLSFGSVDKPNIDADKNGLQNTGQEISTSPIPSFDPVKKSNIVINEIAFQSLPQTNSSKMNVPFGLVYKPNKNGFQNLRQETSSALIPNFDPVDKPIMGIKENRNQTHSEKNYPALDPSFVLIDEPNLILENQFQNIHQKHSPINKPIDSKNFSRDKECEKHLEFTIKKCQNLPENLPLPGENVLIRTPKVCSPPSTDLETPSKKMKISLDDSLSEGSIVRISNIEKRVDSLIASKHYQSNLHRNQSNKIIDASGFQNKSQINLPGNSMIEIMNSASEEKEKSSSSQNVSMYRNSAKSLYVPCGKDLETPDVLSPPYCDAFEIPPKRRKVSEAPTSKGSSDKTLSLEEYNKRVPSTISPHYSQPTCHLSNPLSSNIPLNFSDCSAGSSNFDQNMFVPVGTQSLSTCSVTSLENPSNLHLLNTSRSLDPRLARKFAPTLIQKETSPFIVSQAYSSPSFTPSFIHPYMAQVPLDSRPFAMLNSSGMPLSTETSNPTLDAAKNLQIQRWLSDMKQQALDKSSPVLPLTPSSEVCSLTQSSSPQSIQGVTTGHPFITPQFVPGNVLSFFPQQLVTQEIHPHMYWHPPLVHNRDFSANVTQEFILNPQLPAGNLCPSLPLSPPTWEQSQSSASNRSASNLPPNHETLEAAKSHPMPKQSSFESLLPKQLREDVGKSIFLTNDVYLIIIEKNIDWIRRIENDISMPKIAIFGREFQPVRGFYESHLAYYNTYFPLLLIECFSKISTALKDAKEKTDRIICKVIQNQRRQTYVNFKCEGFLPLSEVQKIPKEGHVVLLKFAALPKGSIKTLGYVCSTTTRPYSHRHDHYNSILKYVNAKKTLDLMKVKITFHTVFNLHNINVDLPMYILKLISIKKTLVLNEALRGLTKSPLSDAVLRPRHIFIKSVVLPRRKDTNAMNNAIQGIVQCLKRSARHLTVVESPAFTDSFLAVLQIVDGMRKTSLDGKLLVCVRKDQLSQMGMNLIGTSNNLIILNSKKERLHETLQNRVLDVMASHVFKAQCISYDEAKCKILKEADVLLAVTQTCFYENVKSMTKDIAYCIIHDAHSFTEPESVLPLLYGIRHLILFGDPTESCPVSSKCATILGYNRSLFHRIYDFR